MTKKQRNNKKFRSMTGSKLVKFLIDRLKPEERQFALDLLSGQTT
ncbi:hypothetical protein [Escherichia coli]|nr:hypothetical protein [Escherichia coli]